MEESGRPPELRLPLLPGFREMALRRMSEERRRLVGELAAARRSAGLSQTEVAARMGTSQSAVARLESGDADAGQLGPARARLPAQTAILASSAAPACGTPTQHTAPGAGRSGPVARPG